MLPDRDARKLHGAAPRRPYVPGGHSHDVVPETVSYSVQVLVVSVATGRIIDSGGGNRVSRPWFRRPGRHRPTQQSLRLGYLRCSLAIACRSLRQLPARRARTQRRRVGSPNRMMPMTRNATHATVEAGGPTVTERTIGVAATTTTTAQKSFPNGVNPSFDDLRLVMASGCPPRGYRGLPMLDQGRSATSRRADSIASRQRA